MSSAAARLDPGRHSRSRSRSCPASRTNSPVALACPGRLEDLMKQGIVKLDAVEIAVLDEADHMADLGFLPGVAR